MSDFFVEFSQKTFYWVHLDEVSVALALGTQ